jgi:phosphoserine aminotransferase
LAAGIRTLLNVPKTHHILFTQGGGTTQFASVVLNLLSSHYQKNPSTSSSNPPKMDYIVTGTWSHKASQEAARLAHPSQAAQVNIVASTKPTGFTSLPARSSYNFSPKGEAAFAYYCENETINGVQFPAEPDAEGAFPFDLVPEGTPLVGDFSSSFLSRPIPNLEKYAVLYAGAQKNLSPSGLTIVIVHEDYLTDANHPATPLPIPEILSYKTLADSLSLYNTPPVFPIYITALVVKLLEKNGGLEAKTKENEVKQKKLYECLEKGVERGVLELNVKPEARSWMNVVWKIKPEIEDGEKRFLAGAEERGLRQLKGHRSV